MMTAGRARATFNANADLPVPVGPINTAICSSSMHTVVTLISSPGSLLDLPPFVTVLGEHERADWLENGRAVDLYYPFPIDKMLRPVLRQLCSNLRVDHIIQRSEGRQKKLLISDMDSTMIEQECIDELAACVGLKDHVSAITERAMRGELDFPTALRERVGLLKNLAESQLEEVYKTRITLMPGAHTLLATMKARGAYCVLVSGGFRFFTMRIAQALGFDADEANVLEFSNGKLTGTVAEPILDKDSKRASLLRLAQEKGLPLSATLAIGDGANDVPMLKEAGLGVAYHAKPIVVESTNAAIHYNDLSAILFAQGIRRSEWVE